MAPQGISCMCAVAARLTRWRSREPRTPSHPFWSPDSASLGFFAKGRLMKVALKGGAPAALADALFPFGGTWSASGTIVFAPDVIMTGLFRVGVRRRDRACDAAGSVTRRHLALLAGIPVGRHSLLLLRAIGTGGTAGCLHRSGRSTCRARRYTAAAIGLESRLCPAARNSRRSSRLRRQRPR